MRRLLSKNLPILLKFAIELLYQRLQASIHKLTYRSLPSPQNVLVVGGSFAGSCLARRLTESLPSGYRVILIEKNLHFNYTFNVPRYSVLQGHEQQAFIPCQVLFKGSPEGIVEQIKDVVTSVSEGEAELGSGRCVPYAYLAIATGATQSPPARLLASEKGEVCVELRALQTRIGKAEVIAVVGGGAVGVQLAADIKSFYIEKKVVLIHSRDQLLSNFGERLHEYVVDKLGTLGVEVLLRERPAITSDGNWESGELMFKDGRTELFDLVSSCTGQTPNSSIISSISPSSISTLTQRILVKPTLQLIDGEKSDERLDHIFALGDVAETGGPKMARAGMMQAEIVCGNIVSLIKGKKLVEYTPLALEGALKLSLGKDENVMYVQEKDGCDFLIPGKSGDIDLEVAKS